MSSILEACGSYSNINISFNSYLKYSVKSCHHVLEHLFFLRGKGRNDGLHVASVKIWNAEHILKEHVGVDESRPGEKMDKTLLVVCHAIQPVLNGFVVNRPNRFLPENQQSMYQFL